MKQNIENIAPEQAVNTNWGGKRKGSGRKRKEHGKYYGFNSSIEVDSILSSLSTSKSDFINEAIVAYARSKGIV